MPFSVISAFLSSENFIYDKFDHTGERPNLISLNKDPGLNSVFLLGSVPTPIGQTDGDWAFILLINNRLKNTTNDRYLRVSEEMSFIF